MDDAFDFSSHTLKPRVQVKREHEEEARPPFDPAASRPPIRLNTLAGEAAASGYLRPGVPLWLSRKHVAKLMGLCRETIWRIVRVAAIRAGVNPERVGCHSYRKSLAVKCWNLSGKNIMAVKLWDTRRSAAPKPIWIRL